jgi:hypothetical protein
MIPRVSHSSTWHHRGVTDSDDEAVQVSIIWPEVDEVPVLKANQFLGQISQGPAGQPEDFVVTIGYFPPPVLLGTPEEQRATMRALGAISVKTLSRVSLSRDRLGELIKVLQTIAEQYDNATGGSPS